MNRDYVPLAMWITMMVVDSTQIAGFMTAILDCMVDTVDEQYQVEFEEEILEAFNIFIKDRFEHTNKYKLEE